MQYFLYLKFLLFSLVLAFVFGLIIKKIALKFKILDIPDQERKLHKGKTPLLGGGAIFLSFFIVLFFAHDYILSGNLDLGHWLGFFMGGLILMIGGFFDDKFNLSPKFQIIFPILAALAIILGGVGIEKITNPFGGYLYLDFIKINLGHIGTKIFYLTVFSDILIFLWIMGMIYTTKILDGLDGLVTGITAIGSFIIFLFTISDKYYQGDIAMASIILFGACLGFLILNWHPAKIFLGEGGSVFLGFALGVLAIISGGKIAIALLIMGIPILDVLWAIVRRLFSGKNPFKTGDRKHLHFRLIDLGLSSKKAVLIYYFISASFGLSALFLQSLGKVFALFFLIIFMILILVLFNYLEKNKNV